MKLHNLARAYNLKGIHDGINWKYNVQFMNEPFCKPYQNTRGNFIKLLKTWNQPKKITNKEDGNMYALILH